jgi:chromate reductase, NAD(P)H dehydrogenase (quinone)
MPSEQGGTVNSTIQVLAIAGSLREDSHNHALLRAAQELAGDSMNIEITDLDEIPPFNEDVEAEGDPSPVVELKRRIRDADALLIATPEYQHGIPGVLKNALDWASRPPGEAPLHGKPTAIMGATLGDFGTARAQEQLRQTLVYNNCPMVKVPEVLVANADDKVDENGDFSDGETLEFVTELLKSLEALVKTHRESPS